MLDSTLIPLLLDSLHPGGCRPAAEEFTRLTREQWQSFLNLARQQQVSALLYHRLTSRGLASAVPDEILLALRGIYMRAAARNLSLFREFNLIVTAMAARSIPVIVLKGLYLAEIVYEKPGLRGMRDLDLMVPVRYLAEAVNVLQAQSYQPISSYRIDATIQLSHELPTFIKTGAAAVELHWHIVDPNLNYSIEVDELWDRAVSVPLAQTSVRALCVEDLLLHLCAHTSYHHEFEAGLRPSCDIAETVRRFKDSLDWGVFTERARRWRWERGAYLALRLAKDLVGAEVPDDVIDGLRPVAFDENVVATAKSQIFAARKLRPFMPLAAAKLSRNAGFASRAGVLWHSIFSPKANLARQYGVSSHSPAIYLYYLVRVKDLCLTHWRTVLNLRRDPTLSVIAQHKMVLHEWLSGEPTAEGENTL